MVLNRLNRCLANDVLNANLVNDVLNVVIYYFYRDGWRQYGPYRKLRPILEHRSTRINALWIGQYLEREHGFSKLKRRYAEEFESELARIPSEEACAILAATKGAMDKIDQVPEVCGHQLAYLRVFLRDRGDELIRQIQARWRSHGHRAFAVRLLRAAQGLTIGELTAAYGGRSHITEALYNEFTGLYGEVLPIVSPRQLHEVLLQLQDRADLSHQAEFCMAVVDKLASLDALAGQDEPIPSYSPRAFPLEDSDFTQAIRGLSLASVVNGELALWTHDMSQYLKGQGTRPDFQALYGLWREIDSNLKRIPILPQLAKITSTLFWGFSEFEARTPPSEISLGLQVLLRQASGAATCLAQKLEDRAYVSLWRTSVPRPLCRRWQRIRESRGEKESPNLKSHTSPV